MNQTTPRSLVIEPISEAKLAAWLANRGGIAVWVNRDLSSPRIGTETLTPAMTDGAPTPSPHWTNGNTPEWVCTDAALITVRAWREVARVKVRQGPPHLGGIHRADRAKLDAAMTAAGEGASWVPDYERAAGSSWFTAVISVPDAMRPFDPTV